MPRFSRPFYAPRVLGDAKSFIKKRNATQPKMLTPDVKPAPHKKLETRQSKYSELPTLPLRGIVLAPSGGGGSTLLQWFILTGYRGLFERIHVISPSIHVDSETWDPVKKYIYGEMGTPKQEVCLHEDWDAQFVENLLAEAMAITQY